LVPETKKHPEGKLISVSAEVRAVRGLKIERHQRRKLIGFNCLGYKHLAYPISS
jgi:hypothetical protein